VRTPRIHEPPLLSTFDRAYLTRRASFASTSAVEGICGTALENSFLAHHCRHLRYDIFLCVRSCLRRGRGCHSIIARVRGPRISILPLRCCSGHTASRAPGTTSLRSCLAYYLLSNISPRLDTVKVTPLRDVPRHSQWAITGHRRDVRSAAGKAGLLTSLRVHALPHTASLSFIGELTRRSRYSPCVSYISTSSHIDIAIVL